MSISHRLPHCPDNKPASNPPERRRLKPGQDVIIGYIHHPFCIRRKLGYFLKYFISKQGIASAEKDDFWRKTLRPGFKFLIVPRRCLPKAFTSKTSHLVILQATWIYIFVPL